MDNDVFCMCSLISHVESIFYFLENMKQVKIRILSTQISISLVAFIKKRELDLVMNGKRHVIIFDNNLVRRYQS